MYARTIIIFLLAPWAWCASPNYCSPTPQIQVELQKAATKTGKDGKDFEQNVDPYRNLRDHNAGDLFAQERYQDAVQQFGIEGHLRALIEEYQTLQIEHPDDWKYQYLFNRSLIGRNTRSAIAGLSEIAQSHPEFAPAHRTLAEIYASETFRDGGKGRTEREQFQTLCPGATLSPRPNSLPEASPLMDEAQKLLERSGDPGQIVQMTNEAIRADEWRLQRVRPFDWYTVDYKRQQQNDLQRKYWRGWEIQVNAYRKAQQLEKADALLGTMEQRAAFLHDEADVVRWNALIILARLYEEGKQREMAAQKLDAIRQLLMQHPDTSRAAQVEDLQRNLPQ